MVSVDIGIWICDYSSPGYVINMSRTGDIIGTYSVPDYPNGVIIDFNKNIWVTSDAGYLTKMTSSGFNLLNIAAPVNWVSPIIDIYNNIIISYNNASLSNIIGCYNNFDGTLLYNISVVNGNIVFSSSQQIFVNTGYFTPFQVDINNNIYCAGTLSEAGSIDNYNFSAILNNNAYNGLIVNYQNAAPPGIKVLYPFTSVNTNNVMAAASILPNGNIACVGTNDNEVILYIFSHNLTTLISALNITQASYLINVSDSTSDFNGDILVSSSSNMLYKFNTSGTILYQIGIGLSTSSLGHVVSDSKNNAWVITSSSQLISTISPSGVLLGSYSTGAGTNPFAIAIDGQYGGLPVRKSVDPVLNHYKSNKLVCNYCSNNFKRGKNYV